MKKIFKFMMFAVLCTFVLGMFSFCDKPEPEEPADAAKIELSLVEAFSTEFKFNAVLTNSTEAAYIVKEGKNISLPAQEIFSQGIKISESKEYLADGLKAQTDYTLLAVAQAADKSFSKVAQLAVRTTDKAPAPTVSLTLSSEAKDKIVFHLSTVNAVDAAYIVMEGKDLAAPAVEEIYAKGEVVAPDAADYPIKKVEELTYYTIFATSQNEDGVYSEVVSLNAFTGYCTFEFSLGDPSHYSVPVSIQPSDVEQTYLIMSFPKAALEEAGVLDDDDAIHQNIIQSLLDQYPGVPQEELLAALLPQMLLKGNIEGEFKPLTPETEHCALVYAMDLQGNKLSRVYKQFCTTTAVPMKDITFDISITDITYDNAHVKITPSDDNIAYCSMGFAKEQYPDLSTAEEYAEAIVAQWGGWMNNGAMLYKGVLDIPYFSVAPGTDYANVVFAYDYGIASEIAMEEFTTPKPGDPEETTYEVEVLHTYSTQVRFAITPSDESTYYIGHLLPAAELTDETAEEVKKGFEEELEMLLQMNQMFDPSFTMAQLVASSCLMGYKDNLIVNYLEANSEYSVLVYGVTQEGKATAHHEIKASLVKTPDYKAGDAVFTTEKYKVFSGTEAAEAGVTMGVDPEVLKGKYIVAVTNTVNEKVDSAFYAFDSSMPMEGGDDLLLASIAWNEFENNQVTEYGFYLFNWPDSPHTIYSVAKDAEGIYGPICKNSFSVNDSMCSPIDELKAILPEESQASKAQVQRPEKIELREAPKYYTIQKVK